jgi:hypothetical protein
MTGNPLRRETVRADYQYNQSWMLAVRKPAHDSHQTSESTPKVQSVLGAPVQLSPQPGNCELAATIGENSASSCTGPVNVMKIPGP